MTRPLLAPHSPRRPLHRRAGLLLAGALLAAGCDLTATPQDAPSPSASPTALGSEPSDPHAAALDAALEELHASLVAAREALAAAGTAAGTGGEDAAELAVSLLAAEGELAEGEAAPDPRPVFPGGETSRLETIDYGDAFTRVLSAARAAGQAGAPVLDLLRDPLAGDIGVWQRDAEGALDTIAATARELRSADLPTAEATVAELDGEGPKALVWALLAADARSDEDRAAYAERGAAHLDVVLAALDDTRSDGPPAGDGSDA